MTFAVGIFDLFTYTIPGSLYLGFFSYVALRVDLVHPNAVGGVPTVLLVVAAVLISYVIGHVAYPVGAVLHRIVPWHRPRRAREEFLHRVPEAHGRNYVKADPALLLSAVQLQDKDVAVEVTRLRAGGLMLRNSSPALVLALVAAIVEVFTSGRPLVAGGCAAVFAFVAVTLVVQGRRLSHWATLKTFELAFWLPDIEEKIRPAGKS